MVAGGVEPIKCHWMKNWVHPGNTHCAVKVAYCFYIINPPSLMVQNKFFMDSNCNL